MPGTAPRGKGAVDACAGPPYFKHSVDRSSSEEQRNPHGFQNAVVETFFKSIKAELVWRWTWETRR
jgi:hypothetical protein